MPAYQTLEMGAALAVDAFQVAVAEHHRRLAGLAYVLTGDRQVAEDLVAEAYARVWGRAQVDDLGPYLRRVVVNLARSRRRRWMVERAHAEIRRPGDEGVVGPFDDRVDARHLLHAALLALPVEQRAVIVLRHLEDLSEQDTAKLLGIRPGTVKSRLARGLEAMRTQFADRGPGTYQEAP